MPYTTVPRRYPGRTFWGFLASPGILTLLRGAIQTQTCHGKRRLDVWGGGGLGYGRLFVASLKTLTFEIHLFLVLEHSPSTYQKRVILVGLYSFFSRNRNRFSNLFTNYDGLYVGT